MTGSAPILAAFGRRVRQLREKKGVSQEQVAERADLHRTYISDIERGFRNPSLVSIARLAVPLGTSPAALLDGIEPNVLYAIFGDGASPPAASQASDEGGRRSAGEREHRSDSGGR